ncbi:MAG: M56 family metallopeptidase [Ruminiclostridium sp.]
MPNILIAIFNMSIASSVVIILALIARFFLRTVSKRYSYMLWAIVCFRLLCPFGLNFQSILNFLQGKEVGNIISRTEYIPQAIGAALFNPENPPAGAVTLILTFLFIIWFLGFIGMVFHETVAYFNARKRLATAIKIQDGVFETDQISTPFIFGLINPKIYVPVGISETELNYVLCHELIHIKRKDYVIKFFGSFVLAIHWFNPFVWLAFKYMSVDMEMSCDEKVVTSLGDAVRKEYAEIIFNFSRTKIKVTRSMLTFGASDTRMRVNNVLNKKRITIIGMTATAIICTILVIGLISNSAISSLFSFTSNGIYTWEVKRLASTDLSGIAVDEIKIGADISTIDLSGYSADHQNTTGDYNLFFDQVRIGIDAENKVRAVTGGLQSINGSTKIDLIEGITSLLGDNYLDKSQDREQQLRKHIYYDREAGVVAEFVYADHTRDLAWITLRKSE